MAFLNARFLHLWQVAIWASFLPNDTSLIQASNGKINLLCPELFWRYIKNIFAFSMIHHNTEMSFPLTASDKNYKFSLSLFIHYDFTSHGANFTGPIGVTMVNWVTFNFKHFSKYLFILHGWYHSCWWPGNKSSQGINSYGVDLSLPNILASVPEGFILKVSQYIIIPHQPFESHHIISENI